MLNLKNIPYKNFVVVYVLSLFPVTLWYPFRRATRFK